MYNVLLYSKYIIYIFNTHKLIYIYEYIYVIFVIISISYRHASSCGQREHSVGVATHRNTSAARHEHNCRRSYYIHSNFWCGLIGTGY